MSDKPRTEADFAKMLNEAFSRGEVHWRLADSESFADHRRSEEKMAAYREWRDATARELATVTAERNALRSAAERGCMKLLAYVGVCRDDKELTGEVLPMLRAAIDAAMAGKGEG